MKFPKNPADLPQGMIVVDSFCWIRDFYIFCQLLNNSYQNDDGGGLVWPNGNRYELYGVFSYNVNCYNNQSRPAIYADVSRVRDWIVHKTDGEC